MFLLADLAVGLLVIVIAFLIFVVALKYMKQEINKTSCEEDEGDCCGDKNNCDSKDK